MKLKISSDRLVFAAVIFLPFSLCFILPIMVYHFPLKLPVFHGAHFFSALLGKKDILKALVVVAIWFIVAISLLLIPYRKHDRGRKKDWSLSTIMLCFVIFSFFGSIITTIHSFFAMPPAFEEITHQLSYLSLIGLAFGIYLLSRAAFKKLPLAGRSIFVSLILLSILANFIVPFLKSTIGDAAYSLLAIIFVLYYCRYYSYKLLSIIIIGLVFIGIGMSVKTHMRIKLYKGLFIRQNIQSFIKNRFQKNNQKPFSLTAKKTGVMTSQQKKKNNKANKLSILYQAISNQTLQQQKVHDSNHELVDITIPQTIILKPYIMNLLRFGRLWPHLPPYFPRSMRKVVNRLNHLTELAYVIKTTPSQISYVYGITYLPLFSTLIPRAILPSKPYDNTGQFFGHYYHLIADNNFLSSQNLPILTEGWINFGIAGVIQSALILGILLRYIWLFFIGDISTASGTMFGVLIIKQAANLESSLSLMVGGILHTIIIFWVVKMVIDYFDKLYKKVKITEQNA